MPRLLDIMTGRYVEVPATFIAKCRAFDAALLARLAARPGRVRAILDRINAKKRANSQRARELKGFRT